MTTGSERRDDGVIVVPSEQDDVVVVSSEDDEELAHRPVTGYRSDGPDDRNPDQPASDRAAADHPLAQSSPDLDAEVLDDEDGEYDEYDETAATNAVGTGAAGAGATGTDVADERRPGEPRAPLSPAGPPAAATRAGAPPSATSSDGDWAAIQAQFVDDPRSAVEQAASMTSAALEQLVEAARGREQTLRQQWQGDGADTEELRTALRGYREFAGRIAGVARDF